MPRAKKSEKKETASVESLSVKPHVTKISIPVELFERASRVLAAQGTDVETLVRLQLGSFCRSKHILSLNDTMNFGKYFGEKVEDIVRADLRYVLYLLNGENGCSKFGPDVLTLVASLDQQVRSS